MPVSDLASGVVSGARRFAESAITGASSARTVSVLDRLSSVGAGTGAGSASPPDAGGVPLVCSPSACSPPACSVADCSVAD